MSAEPCGARRRFANLTRRTRTRLSLALVLLFASVTLVTSTAPFPQWWFDVSAAAGLPMDARQTWGVAWADRGTGYPDVFLNNHVLPPILFENGGGSFSPAAVPWSTPMDRHACAWGEADGGGLPELLCVQGAGLGRGSGPNELWSELPGGWRERAAGFGVTDPLARGRTVNWLDFDRDGDLDVFIGNRARRGYGDVLYRNQGGMLSPVPGAASEQRDTDASTWADWDRNGYPDLLLIQYASPAIALMNVDGEFSPADIGLGDHAWTHSAWGDFNADGWIDLHLLSRTHSWILRNDEGTFRPVHRTEVRQGVASAWIDVNNTGRLGLYIVQGARGWYPGAGGDHPDFMLIQTTHRFVRESLPETARWAGAGDAVAVADYNRDGRMDVLVSNGYGRWLGRHILLENVAAAGNAVAIILRGPEPNPYGYGALARAHVRGSYRWTSVTDAVAGRSQSEPGYVHFGIGPARLAAVTVYWPDGTTDCVSLRAGDVVELVIGAAPCPP